MRGKETGSFLSSLGEKISRKASAYASLRRKTKRAREKVRHDNDTTMTKAKDNITVYYRGAVC
ncbi:MAG: hypothetical protein LBC07_04760 [Elusimicrobiota bacterium]|nr:hypothetical protein [Elusimicrobiota bacterium]